jgi:putative PIN family toxin of toxin-antitoxin system
MSDKPPRAVFDCVVFVQALISGRGPSAACIRHVQQASVALFLSSEVMAEVRDVPLRPALARRYRHLTPELVASFVADIERHSVWIENPPKVFTLPRDAKDEPYVNLAAAADARFLVTWNARHLTYLMRKDTAEGRLFCRRFPELKILSPPEFLREIGQPKI